VDVTAVGWLCFSGLLSTSASGTTLAAELLDDADRDAVPQLKYAIREPWIEYAHITNIKDVNYSRIFTNIKTAGYEYYNWLFLCLYFLENKAQVIVQNQLLYIIVL